MHFISPVSREARRLCRRFACAALVALVSFVSPAFAQETPFGTIRGQVSNRATKSNLSGVQVTVLEHNRNVYTERDGSYVVTGLPPGLYTLGFEYPGLDRQQHTVTVVAGQEARQDVGLTSDVYVLEAFTVAGERAGNAAAIVAQRNAVNVQNVITADAFGNIAKGNVGNFLKRLPGIAGTTDEVETENIVLRGISSEFVSVDIDGARATTGNSGRGQTVAGLPTDMIERVEVVKSVTPDMDANSIGGRINLVTKSAYDRQGRSIELRAAGSYSFTYGSDVGRGRSSSHAPSFAASFADVFSVFGGERNLGVSIRGNWERILDVRGTTSWGDNYTTPVSGGPEYPRFNNVSVALHGVERGGATVKLDYKATPDLSFSTSATYTTYTNDLFRTRNRLRNGTVRPALSGDPFFIVIDGANYGVERSTRHQVDDTVSGRFSGRYSNANGWRIDGSVSGSRTKRERENVLNTIISNRKLDYVLDRREGFADHRWPTLGVYGDFYTGTTHNTTVAPTTYLDVNPFSDDFADARSESDGQWQRVFQDNQLMRAALDVTKTLNTRWPIELKTGGSFQSESVDSWRDDLRGRINVSAAGYGGDLRALVDDTWDLGGAIGRYPPGTMIDLDKITQAMGISYAGPNADPIARWNYDPRVFSLATSGTRQNTLTNTRRAWEDRSAGYFQGSIEMGRLRVLTGLRYEATEVRRNQVARDRTKANTLEEWTTREDRKADYDNLFPSAHLRYSFSKKLVGRASWGRTAGRPDWGSLLGSSDVNPTEYRISLPNLDLRPRLSDNTDLSLEYYFEPVGVVSVGVFQKDIKDFDANATWQITPEEAADLGASPSPGDPTLWTVSSKMNVGTGRVRGIELNYSQQLSNFFRGPLRGLGVFGNYTYLEAEGTFDLDTTSGPPAKRDRLEGFIPRTANAGLSYVYGRYDFRLSWNYTGAFDENTQISNPQRTKVRGARWQMDFSAKYAATEKITLFADLVNLTSNHGLKYRGFPEREFRNETNALGFLLTAGIVAKF